MLDNFWFHHHRRKAAKKEIGYIFCINSGRAGSEYLATLLGTAPLTHSYHEPEPQMIGNYLRTVAENGLQTSFAERRCKSKQILKLVSRFPARSVYVETNHMFIKTFYDVVLHDLENVQVIHLQRDLLQTLKSFVQLCYFSDQNTTWPNWMISPNAKTAKIKCIGENSQLDYIDLCIAYLIDIEARALDFSKSYPQIPFHRIDINDLNNIEKSKQLFENLGLSFTDNSAKIVGKKINQRSEIKDQYANQADSEQLRSRLKNYLERGKEMGISFPERVSIYG